MSQLLSSPPMAVFSKTFINHKFSDARFLSSHSILTSGGFAGKIIPLKPTARLKLTVKSRQSDYFEKQRFGDSSSSQNGRVFTHCLSFEKWEALKFRKFEILFVCLFWFYS